MARLLAAAFGIALLVSIAATVFGTAVAVATVYGVFWIGRRLWSFQRARADARAHRRAELLARAEIQHRWYLAGDPRGTYGRYPPAPVVVRRIA